MIGDGQPLERIGYPNLSTPDAVCLQYPSHEYRCPTAPHPGLDQIARNVVRQHLLYAELNVVQSGNANHRMRTRWPYPSVKLLRRIEGRTFHGNVLAR